MTINAFTKPLFHENGRHKALHNTLKTVIPSDAGGDNIKWQFLDLNNISLKKKKKDNTENHKKLAVFLRFPMQFSVTFTST